MEEENLNIEYNKKILVDKALKRTKGKISEASSLLCVPKKTLYNYLNQFNINVSDYRK